MKFRKAYIEITNRCNLSCDFCPKTSREPVFMDDALFEIICAQLKGRSQRFYLHVMGEPLLHPRLPSFLDICATHGHHVTIITNGVLLTQQGEALVLKPALKQLSVSLHSCNSQSSGNTLHAYFGAIKDFVAKAAIRPELVVQLRLWNKGSADLTFQSMMFRIIQETFELPFPLLDQLKIQRSFMIGKNLCIDSVALFEWPSLTNKDYGAVGTCYGLRKQCAVLADGTVTACCLDNNGTLSLGNIRQRPLMEILSGKRATAIRKGFERGVVVEELCRKCSYRLRFKPDGAIDRPIRALCA
jgi:radical SAM protein with 4Fe4S-binding SPASM domain